MTSLLVFLFGCLYGEGTLDSIDVYDYQVSAITERCGDPEDDERACTEVRADSEAQVRTNSEDRSR